jgi:hypothetical protein
MLASLEELETKATATLQYLKDKGHATDKDLAPYFEQAGNASNVRWRAARLRMMSLLSSAMKSAEEPTTKSQKGLKQENTQPDNAKKRKAADETVARTKPSVEAAASQAQDEADRAQDTTASEPIEKQAPEKDPINNERKMPSDEAPVDSKSPETTPQKGAA